MDPSSVLVGTITAIAVFTAIAVSLLLYLVAQQTTSFWHISRVYSLAAIIAFGLGVVTFSATPYVIFPVFVLITFFAIVLVVAVNISIVVWEWRSSWKRQE